MEVTRVLDQGWVRDGSNRQGGSLLPKEIEQSLALQEICTHDTARSTPEGYPGRDLTGEVLG